MITFAIFAGVLSFYPGVPAAVFRVVATTLAIAVLLVAFPIAFVVGMSLLLASLLERTNR
jgi:hypothetical protein